MRSMRPLCVLTILLTAATPAAAQVVSRPSLTLDGAKRVIAAAVAEAKSRQAPGGVIAVVDDGGNLMALERLDQTFAAGANISIGKARTAALFKRPTRVFEDIIRNGRTAMTALPDFTPLQGGVPLIVDGVIVGGVGVSGAASAQQDEELALAGANALGMPTSVEETTAPVLYFNRGAVAESFAKGAVLVGDAPGRNYMVHTSRRDQAGLAEVHARDTDIVYVIRGTATFVTGGSVVDGKTTATDEIRGASIRGGEARQLVPGDVVVVPNGTPHWFKAVDGVLEYYVVKVSAPSPAMTKGERK
jgi:glc operon protein GlcG